MSDKGWRWQVVLTVTSISLLPTTSQLAVAQIQSHPLFINDPFASQAGITRLSKMLEPIIKRPFTKAEITDLAKVRRLEYTFDPAFAEGEKDRPRDSVTALSRQLISDVSDDLSAQRIESGIRSGFKNDCERNTKVQSVTILFTDNHHLVLRGHAKHDQFYCGHFLGIPYKTDAGSGSADFTVRYELTPGLSPKSIGDVEITNERVDKQAWWDFLGLFGAGAFLTGKVVERAIRQAVEKGIANAADKIGAIDANQHFSALTAGVKTLTEYTSAIDESGDIYSDPQTNFALSGFVIGSEAAPRFILVQTAELVGSNANREYQKRVGEIRFFLDLPFSSPEDYIVRPGESLWRIAKRRYSDPRIYIMVEDMNGLRRKRLTPGDRILLPRLWQVFEGVSRSPTLVAPGDTLVGLRKRRDGKLLIRRSQLRSGDLNKIYPYESVQ